jgi:uncharacterized protein YndB with AHSA1/START domain
MTAESSVIAPLVKNAHVKLTQAQAFELFTEGMGQWWPLETHSLAADTYDGRLKAERLVFEPRQEGRIYEVMSNGEEANWGSVILWDPPSRLVISWKPNLSDGPFTEVEVRFTQAGSGTDVELEHRGWDRFGSEEAGPRANYDSGWSSLLELYQAAVHRR